MWDTSDGHVEHELIIVGEVNLTMCEIKREIMEVKGRELNLLGDTIMQSSFVIDDMLHHPAGSGSTDDENAAWV